MPRISARFALATLAALATPAVTQAGSITSDYTVTDLGVGSAALSAATGSNATVTSTDGRFTYAFGRTDNQVPMNTASPYGKLPTLDPDAPYGTPSGDQTPGGHTPYAYRNYQGPIFLNQNGLAAVTEVRGVSGHAMQGSHSQIDLVRHQSDGSFTSIAGPAGVDLTSPFNSGNTGVVPTVLDLNNQNQLLARLPGSGGGMYSSPYQAELALVNLDTGIQTVLADSINGWSIRPWSMVALDDQGRILVQGTRTDSDSPSWMTHSLLLTPAGLSADPIPTPEPATWAFFALVAGSVAWRTRR